LPLAALNLWILPDDIAIVIDQVREDYDTFMSEMWFHSRSTLYEAPLGTVVPASRVPVRSLLSPLSQHGMTLAFGA
jgi:hypothetical protein